MSLDLATAQALLNAALRAARATNLNPLGIVVLGTDESVRAAVLEDGATKLRFEIARAKATGALRMRRSSRELEALAIERPAFFQSLVALNEGMIVAAAGGMLIPCPRGDVIGAIGVSGDTSDNDESCALSALAEISAIR